MCKGRKDEEEKKTPRKEVETATVKGDETPKQVELDEEPVGNVKDLSISIDIDIDESLEGEQRSIHSAVRNQELETLSEARLRKVSETTEYVAPRSLGRSMLTFSMQDSPVPKVVESDEKEPVDSAQRPKETPLARRLFGEGASRLQHC